MDFWPITLSRLCRRIDRLTATEIVDMTRYTSIHMGRDAIGFGLSPDQPTRVDESNRDVYQSAYYIPMRMLADAIGIELEEVRYRREVAVTDHAFEIAINVSSLGTLTTWAVIVLCQMKLHRWATRGAAERPAFRMPFAPYSSYATLAFVAAVLVLMALDYPVGTYTVTSVVVVIPVLIAGWFAVRHRVQIVAGRQQTHP